MRPLTLILLALFRILNHLRPLPSAPEAMPSPARVLIFSTAGIGDTMSDTPAIRAVKETFPAAFVSVVVHAGRRAVLESNPWIDELIPHRKALSLSTLIRIRRRRPDIAIVLRANDPEIWPLAWLSGANVLVSRPESTRFRFLVNAPVSIPDWSDLPGVIQTLEIVKRIGATTPDARMVFHVTDAERLAMQRRVTEFPQSPARIAVQIHHSPRLAFRDWPESSFIALIRKILEDYPVTAVLTGGPDDQAKAGRIYRHLAAVGFAPRVVNMTGRMSIRETAALISQCDLFVTTDTGVMHIGFALNVPTLAILHSYNARRVAPHGYGNRHRTVVMSGPDREPDGTLRPLHGVNAGDVLPVFKDMYAATLS